MIEEPEATCCRSMLKRRLHQNFGHGQAVVRLHVAQNISRQDPENTVDLVAGIRARHLNGAE